MRYYKLKIQDKNGGAAAGFVKTLINKLNPKDEWEFGVKNPTGLNLKFNINFFEDAISTTIPQTIELFNAPTDLYLNAQAYIGKSITLTAGFENSALTIKGNFKHVSANTLVQGVITNVIPNYSSFTQPSVIFSLSGDYAKQNAALRANAYKGFTVQLNPPKLDSSKIANWLKNFIPEGFTVKPDLTTLSAMSMSTSTITLNAKTFLEAANKLEELGFFLQLTDTVIKMSYVDPLMESTMANSFSGKISKNAGLSILATLIASATGLMKTIEPEEMVSQPQILSPVKTQVTTMLRGDLKMGEIVKLSGRIKPSISSVSFGSITSMVGGNKLEVFTGGKFRIVGINHMGDSRNPSPEAWVTSLELVKA